MRDNKSSKKFLDGPKICCRTYAVRGVEVMLDFDLANIFKTTTGRLNQAVKRNRDRFPKEFMFKVTGEEFENLISQFVISSSETSGWDIDSYPDSNLDSTVKQEPFSRSSKKSEWGGYRHLPYAFTERGMIELASVLKWDLED
jgi:hypothetical protein